MYSVTSEGLVRNIEPSAILAPAPDDQHQPESLREELIRRGIVPSTRRKKAAAAG